LGDVKRREQATGSIGGEIFDEGSSGNPERGAAHEKLEEGLETGKSVEQQVGAQSARRIATKLPKFA